MHTGCLGMDCMCGWMAKGFDTLVSQLLWTLCNKRDERKYWWMQHCLNSSICGNLIPTRYKYPDRVSWCPPLYTMLANYCGLLPLYTYCFRFTKMPTYTIIYDPMTVHHTHCLHVSFISTPRGPSVYMHRLKKKLPSGRSFVCMDNAELPQILQQIFLSTLK